MKAVCNGLKEKGEGWEGEEVQLHKNAEMADSSFREYGGSLIPWSTSCTVSKAAFSHCKWTSRENVQKGLPVNVRDSRARAEREGWRCCRGTEEEVLRLLRRQWLSWGNGGIFKTRQGRDLNTLWQWKEGRNRGSKGEIGGSIADACVEKQTEGTYSHLIPSHMTSARIDSVTGEVDNCWASPQNSSVALQAWNVAWSLAPRSYVSLCERSIDLTVTAHMLRSQVSKGPSYSQTETRVRPGPPVPHQNNNRSI